MLEESKLSIEKHGSVRRLSKCVMCSASLMLLLFFSSLVSFRTSRSMRKKKNERKRKKQSRTK